MKKWFIIGVVVALCASGCAMKPATNSDGSAVTGAQNAIGTAYATYDAATATWIAALTGGKVTRANIIKGEQARKLAYNALNNLRLASKAGDTAALQVSFDQAMQVFADFLKSLPTVLT